MYRVYDPAMKSSELIKLLEANGWTLSRIRGSHHVYVHASRSLIITVPHPRKDLGKGLLNNLLKTAGLK